MTDSPADHDAALADLLDRLMQSAAAGEAVDVDAAARDHPELAHELRGLWATMQFTSDFLKFSAMERPRSATSDDSSAREAVGIAELPRWLGGYQLLEELGRGGMGVVYRARQPELHRIVALKLILRGELATPEDRERFRTEATAAAQLTHPHVVPVYEVGEAEGQLFFSMQYVAGETLAQRLSAGPLPPREAAELLLPLCRAIAAAHARGVLHRDLKPSNILIDASGRPFVTDFGLAKQIRPTEPGDESAGTAALRSITHSGAVLGTPGYMAPEQAAGDRGEVGPATDVYGLGAILYALLTGRAPFQAASPIDTVLMVLEQDPPPPRLLNPQVDPDLEMVALKALQKPTDLRYPTADAIGDDLERYLHNEPVSARTSHFAQILSRAFRPTHHAAVLENWGLLWMWHAVVILLLCLVTNGLQLAGSGSRLTYVLLWTVGLGTWAGIFWELRRRAGPVTFVERQVAHVWAASMACSTGLFAVEWLLGLEPLRLSPVLALIAGAVFVAKAGILSGEFYLHAAVVFAACVPMALYPRYAVTMFGLVSFATFFLPGWKFHRQRHQNRDRQGAYG